MNSENFNQLDETNLSKINGGTGVISAVITVGKVVAGVGGIVCGANEVYKFGQGVVQGWKDHD
ncbi:hypothetical protein CF095_03830 [Clostridium botulinum]|uniref:Blp family class II bacteriocin n=1 Tax=Clostridium botulinum TaxID=1491 RepID=UPI000A16CCE5|nr:hypothetical protein [Clostridium botulinum]AUN16595.1 hypothetical protein B2M06_02915 [Clostridium botulinum]OSA85298.1 hypothetical protein B2H91_14240 [Clostridium botulinum]